MNKQNFWENEDGVSIYEYALLLMLIAGFVIGLQWVNQGVNGTLNTASNAIDTTQQTNVAPPPFLPSGNGWQSISNDTANSLSGGNAQQVAQAGGQGSSSTGSNNNSSGNNNDNTTTTISITGDPHTTTTVGGVTTVTTTSTGNSDFATYQNTAGGATTFSDTVQGSGVQVSGSGIKATNYYVNSVGVSGAGFNLTTTDVGLNNIQTVLNTGGSMIPLQPGQSYNLPNGDKIKVASNGAITLTQPLSSGGTLISTITQGSYNGNPYLDLNQTSSSDLVISGSVAGQITGTPGVSVITL